MGYLNSTELIVDAILTKKGREKLATGEGLNITKFALGDDEVDYSLYEPAHPKGSAYYDSAIVNTPVIEATPDEGQVLRYKLVTLPKNTTKIPLISIGFANITVNQTDGAVSINPTTSPSGNQNAGYTAILADKNAGSLVGQGLTTGTGTVPVFLGDEVTTTAQVETGLTFNFVPNPNATRTISTTITIYGNETGGSKSIPVTVNYITS